MLREVLPWFSSEICTFSILAIAPLHVGSLPNHRHNASSPVYRIQPLRRNQAASCGISNRNAVYCAPLGLEDAGLAGDTSCTAEAPLARPGRAGIQSVSKPRHHGGTWTLPLCCPFAFALSSDAVPAGLGPSVSFFRLIFWSSSSGILVAQSFSNSFLRKSS